jgi:hypothetical protein
MGIGSSIVRPLAEGLIKRLAGTSELMSRPGDAPHGSAAGEIPGENPARILIFGNGMASGWGVSSNALALPGQLAQAVSRLTGRDAETDLIDDYRMTIITAEQYLLASDLSSYDAMVITIGVSDALSQMAPRRWREGMDKLVRSAVDGTPPGSPILVVGIAPFRGIPILSGILGLVGDRHALVLNVITRDLCAGHPDVVYSLLEGTTLAGGGRVAYRNLYTTWAAAAADLLVPRLAAPG